MFIATMAETLYNSLVGCPCGNSRTRRRVLAEMEPIKSESQVPKRRKTTASLLDDMPANPANTVNSALSSSGRQKSPVLAIPHPDDTIHQLSSKLIAIAKVIIVGESIAIATAFSAAPVQERSASKAVTSQMTPLEMEAWTAFTRGTWQLPEFDWDNNLAPAPTSPKSLKAAHRRAEALNQLYKTDRAHKGHVAWVTQNLIEVLPLIKAMARVIGSERNLVGGRDGWSPTQFADLQSINKILSLSEQICQGRGMTVLSSDIPGAMNVLRIKRRHLQALTSK